MRFCSSCGFLLTGVSELLANDGVTQTALEIPAKNKGSRLGAKLIFFSLFSVPVFFTLAIFTNGPALLFIPAFFFLVGIAHMTYKRIFREGPSEPKIPRLPDTAFYSEPLRMPSPLSGADPLPPASVTDPTTKLFEQPTVIPGKNSGSAEQ